MTKEETKKVLAYMKFAFPGFYKDLRRDEADGIVALWTEMFEDEPFELVAMAVKQYISMETKRFQPPGIGEIKEAIRKSMNKDELTEMQAWGLVSKALRNGNYGSQEEFDKLPETIQKVVGSPEQLKVWAALDANEVETVIQSNFLRSYREKAEQARAKAKIPRRVLEFAESLQLGQNTALVEVHGARPMFVE